MVRKSFLVILISLFAVSILLAGCSSEKNELGSDGLPVSIVKTDVSTKVPVQTTTPVVNPNSVVDKTLNSNTAASNDPVAIGSLIQ